MRRFKGEINIKMCYRDKVPTLEILWNSRHLFDLTIGMIRHRPTLLVSDLNKDCYLDLTVNSKQSGYCHLTESPFKGLVLFKPEECSDLEGYYIITANRENFREVFGLTYDAMNRIVYFDLPGTPTYKFRYSKFSFRNFVLFPKDLSI